MSHTARTDGELVVAAQENPDEFRFLYRRHYDAVYRFVARRFGTNDAEDVVSETFLTAYRILDRFEEDRSSALPWLCGIASNTIGTMMRTRKRRDRIHMAIAPDPPATIEEAELAARVDIAAVSGPVANALARSPKRDRDAFLLFALAGLTYREIGEALGIPTGTVAGRVWRVRKRFREAGSDLDQILKWMDPSNGGGASK